MQPVRRYDVDAAILFSDILVVPQALGVEVTMPGGVGIQVPRPITSVEMAEEVVGRASDPKAVVESELEYVMEGVKMIKKALADEGRSSVPLIGFSAAPWTLFYYMLGGTSKKNKEIGTTWVQERPEASLRLMDALADTVIEYTSAQVSSGADCIQIFEAMGMMLSPEMFHDVCLPLLERIGVELKRRHPLTPLIVFARGASHGNAELAALGVFDVITIDGEVSRDKARDATGERTIQGNFDPRFLVPGEHTGKEKVREEVRKMLGELGTQRYIANLGEGLGGKESTELVEEFVNAVHDISEEINSGRG